MNPFKVALLSSLMLSLSACVSDDKLTVNSNVNDKVKVPSAWTTQIKNNLPPPERWLKQFNDPMLMTFINEGKRNNLDLKIAASTMNKAWLMAEKSGVALKPTVDLSLNRSQSGNLNTDDSSGTVSVGLQSSWELDVWGRIQLGIDAAKSSAESAEADYLFAEHSLSTNIAKSYFKVIEAELQAQITAKNVGILEKNLKISQVKYNNGSSSAQDIALSKANLASAKEQLIATLSSKRDAIRALEILLGRYPSGTLKFAKVLPNLPSFPSVSIPSSVLERRPDLIAAERQVAAAYSATAQAKVAQLPSFSLNSNLNGASSDLSNVLSPANVAWQLAGKLFAPLFDGGRGELDIEIATTDQKQAIANYKSKALGAFSEIEKNLDLGISLAKRETVLSEAYQQNEKAYRIADLRYQEGETELLDKLQIQQQTISAQSKLLSIKRSQLDQRINLYLSLGGSW